jgi:prolipoprotein diacylglyceryltransferase
MSAIVETWLASLGLPAWLAPTYATLVGVGAIVAAAIVLWLTEREGDDRRGTATTLLVAYVAALLGGYVYEGLRVTPEAIATLSLHPYMHVGRAAYGGLLFAALAAAVHVHRRGASPARFLDRVALVLGIVFLAVRTGCFLAGCDYGTPTESVLGVSYPPGSLAAIAHAEHGWIADGAASVPVHASQLYEGAVAVVGSLVALVL